MLQDDPSVDTHHDGTSLDGERPTCEAVDPVYPGDESPKISGGCVARMMVSTAQTTQRSTTRTTVQITSKKKVINHTIITLSKPVL